MASQLEQLLTCCICLDRYRNPKLLPCQHSVCMEPCMEGLVDYVRRQVKCPECRAEHRIPYNGVQGFPSNVTLQRFLEAHIEITGEVPDPFTGQIMERCGVCNEKNYLSTCAHCEKKICVDCKAAHTEILKREIGRINNQVRRAFHRLSDQLSIVERNITALKHNSDNVTEEMDNISKRLQKAIRDRSDFLRNEVMTYYNTELRNLTLLKEGLDQEISNVESNMDLADKHMDDQTSWDDAELMDTKDIFLRTMEFIRSFDYEAGDYNRRAKFNAPDDLNKLAATLSTLGELIISNPKQTIDSYGSGSSSLPSGLMKSKSDHRLAAQFRDQEESFGSGRTSPVSRRRFGDRLHIHEESAADSPRDGRHRFRSRFMRREEEEERPTRYDEETVKTRQRVIDTEDVSRGPLSGILRMVDSPRVIERLQERDRNLKKKKEEPPKPPTPVAQTPKPVTFGTPRKTARQASNDDEIDKIKKQNKNEATSSSATATPAKPALERLTSLKDTERSSRADRNSVSPRSSTHSPSNTEEETTSTSRYRDYSNINTTTPSAVTRKTSTETPPTTQRTYPFSPSSSTSSVGESGRSAGSKVSVKPTENSSFERRLSRSNSTESNKSNDGASSPRTGAAFSTDELKNRFQKTSDTKSSSSTTPSTRSSAGGSSRFQSRFLARPGTPSVEASKESGNEDEEEESSEESDSEESEETSDEEEEKENVPLYSRSDGGTHAGRSTRDSARKEANNHSSSSNTSANDSGYGSSSNGRYIAPSSTNSTDVQAHRRPSYLESSRLAAAKEKEREDEFESKYPYASKFLNRSKTNDEEAKTPFQSRFLNKSKSSALLGPDALTNDDDSHSPSTIGSSSRAKFEELKEKRQRLARSKSSAGMDEEETTPEPATTSYRSRYGRDNETTAPSTPSSRLTSTPEDSAAPANQLSNWAKYLKNKYGNKTGTGTPTSPTGIGNSIGATASSSSGASSSALSSRSPTSPSSRAVARSRSSHLLGFGKDDSSEDDSKNVGATPTSPVVVGTLGPTPFGNIHRSQTLHEERLLFKIGSRGSEPGSFTWPRGIAIGPDDSIVVADSSNHRVQVFDKEGNYVKFFGSYGNGEGEFDCLSGVAVNKSGQYIIADRYNHRVQIFDSSGMFLRSFGCQGSGDGKFSYPWGVTTDILEFIYVCDKENHRIQVFQSDGTFVGKFGTIGNKPGQLEHPHYIAVSSTNRVIVSDSNNHRIQIFDTNGKLMSTFGSEGSDEGQFKFPRGVAVDEQGSIYVADSGNNRIQIFHADGSFNRCFGCWGSNDGEFKGLEGVGVMSNGNILICDRENHRVQVF